MHWKTEAKTCEVCKEEFHAWHGESDPSFKNRKTCSEECRKTRRAIQNAKSKAKASKKWYDEAQYRSNKERQLGNYFVKNKTIDAWLRGQLDAQKPI
jgi:hypothetical protein